jgi:hypothetical protein
MNEEKPILSGKSNVILLTISGESLRINQVRVEHDLQDKAKRAMPEGIAQSVASVLEDSRVHPCYHTSCMCLTEMGIALHHLQGFVP